MRRRSSTLSLVGWTPAEVTCRPRNRTVSRPKLHFSGRTTRPCCCRRWKSSSRSRRCVPGSGENTSMSSMYTVYKGSRHTAEHGVHKSLKALRSVT